jgi:hypothetical protein
VDNLSIYNKSRTVPKEAQKEIQAGRLKGKTDINPMWRIKSLTEQFGTCGIGWKYVITKQWLENGGKDEIAAFVNIDLFIKVDDMWSDAIPGTGGSSFVASEKNGLYTSDECFKMALTDAISVSCKALGFGADIYWEKDSSKYDKPLYEPTGTSKQQGDAETTITTQMLLDMAKTKGYDEAYLCKKYSVKETKFIKQEVKKEAYEKLKTLPNKI